MNKTKTALVIVILLMQGVACTHHRQPKLLDSKNFSKVIDGKQTYLYTLKNTNGCYAQFTNYGGRWISMWVPNRKGELGDVALGFESLESYHNAGEKYHGAIVGRICGRIGKGIFVMDGDTFKLANNDGFGEPVPNNLHGGKKGFHDIVWIAKTGKNNNGEEYIEFSYLSHDGEEGFPGNLNVKVTYTLTNDNSMKIEYFATTDMPTLVNLTNHVFFNLTGNPANDVLSHLLTIKADSFVECDQYLVPTGRILPVAGTPLDFTRPTKVGQNINNNYSQVFKGKGYAAAYVNNLDKSKPLTSVALLEDTVSGRTLEVITDQPSLQFYNGWLFNGKDIGKGNIPYNESVGLVLETQKYPDAPNHPNFPSVKLYPGQEYHHIGIYKFDILK